MSKDNGQFVKEITDPDVNFPQWYTDVVLKTQLVDYGPTKGSMVIRPYGYALWENIQHGLDMRFKATGHVNAYFPLLIPYSFLAKEAEHVEGFAPEVAVVTHAGGEKLAEPLVVRPTSETVICDMYAKWVQSYRDLPVLINQWANVVRWEKTTRPFLRTSEFLWQEGHTLHATEEEAREETLKMLGVYAEFCQNELAMPVLSGRKSDGEKFAGAAETYSIEAMMLDGKSLQSGTSHFLAQNFSKSFNIRFLDRDGALKNPWQTSWGVSTRLIGAVIMAHGDKRGLKLPPRVAPVQCTIIPIAAKKPGVLKAAQKLAAKLEKKGVRVQLDVRDQSPGWKFNECEMKGVPLRLELGPRDIENGVCLAVRRDTGEKCELAIKGIEKAVLKMLDDIQANMYAQAKHFMDSHIRTANSMDELGKAMDDKCFALSTWCGSTDCEAEIKTKFQATSRNMPFDQKLDSPTCVCCGKKGKYKIYFGRAY